MSSLHAIAYIPITSLPSPSILGYMCDSEEHFNVRLTRNMLFEQASSTALRLHNFLAIAALTEQSTLSLDPLERDSNLNLLAVLI